jgi:hypothetical protein
MGALTVIEAAKSSNEILVELRKIEPRLFLERQVTIGDQAVWCVVYDAGSDHPPMCVLEWRDADDHPIHELSYGIVERIKKMEQQSGSLTAEVIRKNSERIEAKRRQTQQQWAEIGTDFERLMSPGHSAVLHRGPHLRRSRDTDRSRRGGCADRYLRRQRCPTRVPDNERL